MNKARRTQIDAVIKKIDDLMVLIEDISSDIQQIYDDEEYYLDSIPENLQGSIRYDTAEEACDALDSALSAIKEIDLDEVKENLCDARG